MSYLVGQGFSQRLACRVAGLSRSAYCRARAAGGAKTLRDHGPVRQWMNDFAATHRRWGYKRAWARAKSEGVVVGRDRACQFFCVWGLEVGGDSVGVGGGELGEGLFPVGGGASLDEACGGCSFVGGFACVCEALGGSFVFDVANSQPQEFDGGFFAGEMPAVLGDFT